MSDFHDIRLPTKLAIGASGGPYRPIDITTLASGREVRIANWAKMRRRWSIGGAINSLQDLHDLVSFFIARGGRLHGFRFRDPMDYSSVRPGEAISPDDQVLGVGDGLRMSFQLTKAYGTETREITKPVVSSVRVAVGGNELVSGWSIDGASGTIYFDAPPLSGEIVSAGFEFDCVVRFGADEMTGVVEAFNAGRVVSMELVELV